MTTRSLRIPVFSKYLLFVLLGCIAYPVANAQENARHFTRADTLRGSNGPFRSTWDVLKYELTVIPDFNEQTITGKNELTFFDNGVKLMQVDLQVPMILDSVTDTDNRYNFRREGNVYWVELRDSAAMYKIKPHARTINLHFHGKPRRAVNAPWDGGWIWTKDQHGNPWMTVACQGLGASVWYPCKDIQSDEPDSGVVQHIVVPDSLVAVANGRLESRQPYGNGYTKYTWKATAPVNNYCIVPYIGKYVHFGETYSGEKGKLDLDYWVLPEHLEAAKRQFNQVPGMLKAFEYWFGPYPFYADGYKIVDAPFLGMEHQGAIAYGNQFRNGYNNSKRGSLSWSGTKWEQQFDYIIVHESGHEWFGNNITSKDIADMWIHESFTTYSEVLYLESAFGKDAAADYLLGTRRNILQRHPMIGPYGVNADGDLDLYFKGSSIINMIRAIINDDAKFRAMLRGMNSDFYHKTVTTQEIEEYISRYSGMDLSKVFDQYLRTSKMPVLEYFMEGKKIKYRWADCVEGFNMPVKVSLSAKEGQDKWINPNRQWQTISTRRSDGHTFIPDKNFLVRLRIQKP